MIFDDYKKTYFPCIVNLIICIALLSNAVQGYPYETTGKIIPGRDTPINSFFWWIKDEVFKAPIRVR